MLFDDGMFHADPHTDNLFLLDDGRLGILDFGMTGRIDETLRETIEDMLVVISSGDQSRLTRLIRRIGDPPPTLDESALAIDAADFVGTYGRQTLGDIRPGRSDQRFDRDPARTSHQAAQPIGAAAEDVDFAGGHLARIGSEF